MTVTETHGAADAQSVFISYPSPDRSIARVLAHELRSNNVEVFFDESELKVGDRWARRIRAEIPKANAFITLITPATNDAYYQESELHIAVGYARKQGLRVIPIRLGEQTSLPFGTEQLHRIELAASPVDAIPAILAALADEPCSVLNRIRDPRMRKPPPNFSGRSEQVATLARTIRSETAASKRLYLHGLPGVGKTSILRSLVEELVDEYEIVWTINAENEDSFINDLVRLAVELDLDQAPARDTAEAVRQYLNHANRRWFLAIDNATDPDALAAWLPDQAGGNVVLTTWHRRLDRIATPIHIEPFDRVQSRRFLSNIVPDSDPRAVRAVATELDGHPLALTQAASWVGRSPLRSFDGYLELLADTVSDPFPEETRPGEYPHTALRTSLIALDAATQESSGSTRLLAALSYLPSEQLPLSVARAAAHISKPVADVDGALTALFAYSLTELTEHHVSTHRVVQAATRHLDNRVELPNAIACARATSPSDPRSLLEPVSSAQMSRLCQQLIKHTASLPQSESAEDLWWILDDALTHELDLGDPVTALTLANAANALALAHFESDDPNLRTTHVKLANALAGVGDFDRAIGLASSVVDSLQTTAKSTSDEVVFATSQLASIYDDAGAHTTSFDLLEGLRKAQTEIKPIDAFAIEHNLANSLELSGRPAEAVTRLEQLLVAMTAHSPALPRVHILETTSALARAQHASGDSARALATLRSVIPDFESELGEQHPQTLATHVDLGRFLDGAGDHDGAVAAIEAVLPKYEALFGPNHPATLGVRHDLATMYGEGGDFARAIKELQDIVKLETRLRGSNHPETITAEHNLGSAYLAAGNASKAEAVLASVSTRRSRVLPPNHPHVSLARLSHAAAVSAAGRPAEALPQAEKAVQELETILSPDHSDLVDARSDLAFLFEAAGQDDEAKRIWAEMESAGTATATSRHNHALSLADDGNHSEAVAILQEIYESRAATLGPTHVDTLLALGSLATTMMSIDPESAQQRQEEAVTLSTRAFGSQHPQTLTARHNYAMMLAETRPSQAVSLSRQVLADRDDVLGPSHPDSLATRRNLAAQLSQLGALAEASTTITEAVEIAETHLESTHPTLKSLREVYDQIEQLLAIEPDEETSTITRDRANGQQR